MTSGSLGTTGNWGYQCEKEGGDNKKAKQLVAHILALSSM
jgi:hypothetical protein